MKNMKLSLAMAAAFALGAAGSSHAAPVTPTQNVVSGNVYGGWRITINTQFIHLVVDGSPLTNGVNLDLEKFAGFQSNEGLDITFTQVDTTATSKITIDDEHVTNATGTAWSGFQFVLVPTLVGGGGPPAFASGKAFAGLTPPFADQTDSPNLITLSNGVLADGHTADWGEGPNGGALVIDANPSSSTKMKQVIDFKEIPIVAAVPLPAAAWTGLSGLLGLGLIAGFKRVRRLMA